MFTLPLCLVISDCLHAEYKVPFQCIQRKTQWKELVGDNTLIVEREHAVGKDRVGTKLKLVVVASNIIVCEVNNKGKPHLRKQLKYYC